MLSDRQGLLVDHDQVLPLAHGLQCVLLYVHGLWQAAVGEAIVLSVQVLGHLLELYSLQALVQNPRIVKTSVRIVG